MARTAHERSPSRSVDFRRDWRVHQSSIASPRVCITWTFIRHLQLAEPRYQDTKAKELVGPTSWGLVLGILVLRIRVGMGLGWLFA